MSTTMSTVTAATAAAGPARRRGRWFMDSITRSSVPLMKVGRTGSGPASSKVTGSEGLGTGGGGTGGTGGRPGLRQAHRRGPRARNALAGKAASRRCRSVARPRSRGEVRPHLLERVELPVVVLHRVHVVVGASAHEHARGQSHQDHDSDYPTDQHQLIFNRIRRAGRAAADATAGAEWRGRAASRGRDARRPAPEPGLSGPGGGGWRRGCRLDAGCSGRAARGWGR